MSATPSGLAPGRKISAARNILSRNLLLLAAACLACSGCGDTIEGKSIAEPAATAFHDKLNAGKFDEIYLAASAEFHKAASQEKVIQLFAAIGRKLGKAQSSATTNWNVRTFNFNTIVVLVQDTKFEQGQATETFTFRISDGKAVLMGYTINSLDMLIK